MRKRFAKVASICGIWLVLIALGPTAGASNFNPPKHFYLALGDSVAFGAQLGKFFQELSSGTYDPASFNSGYVDDFAAQLRSINPQVDTVNMSCPGETTNSFSEQCAFHSIFGLALHTNYSGSQLAAALSFLRAHPGQVSPITITLGLNDALLPCAGPTFLVDVACVHTTMPAALQTVPQNLTKILGELQQASPSSEIIVMTYYNAFFVEDPSTDALFRELNDEIADVAEPRGVRVADTFKPFNRKGNESATICGLTLMCPNRDYHPSDAGYAVIARQFWAASGFGRIDD